MHNPRARFHRFAVWWALFLAHVLYSCASSAPEDTPAEDEPLGQVTQALCAEPDHQCPGIGGACCAQDVSCCGTRCLGQGQTCCGNDVICAAGKTCVDGVCCNTACDGVCQRCGANGVCANSANNTDPDNECSPITNSCARGEMCDGAGACRPAALGTTCAPTTCSGGSLTVSQCDAGGTCVSSPLSCTPYLCASGTACRTSCTIDTHCATNAFCRTSDSTCQPDRANGQSCSGGTQCASGNCVDGVCCESACAGTCQACSAAKKGSGSDGFCENIAEDTDPDGECADDGQSSCDHNGFCDGSGACANYALGTSCGSTTCSMGQQSGHSCNGFGSCDPTNVTQCTPYSCSGDQCATTCASDANCIASAYCSSDDECEPDQGNGSSCSSSSQCTSGHCVDGFCCDTACAGTCDACSAAKKGTGSDGTCGAIKEDTDPDSECADEGANSCKKDGTCNGNHSCKLYENGTACGATTCSAGTQTGFACNGLGTCNPSTSSSCAPYVCADTVECADTCASDAGCVASSYCRVSDHTCQTDQAKGATCTSGTQCASGNCVDGFCCDAPCNGACQACSAAKTGGANGTCRAVIVDTDPDGECPDDGAPSCARNGLCDGVGACKKYASGTACGSTTCSMGMQAGYACDGAGTCKQSQSTACAPYVCSGTACGNTCASDAGCVANAFCDASSHCVPDQPNGSSCTKASQCTTGNCVDGVCCDQACAGLCQACSAARKGSGNDGECGNIKTGTDPDNDCAADAPDTCKNDGDCDGQGACKRYGPGTGCGNTQCSGSQLTGFQCDGLGECKNQTSTCSPYVCLTSSCADSCGDDNACIGGTYCAGSTCKPKLDNGEPCSAGRECSTGFCVEGVCCDTACNGVCQACTAANKASGEDGACDLAKVGTDAHGDCPDEGALSCKRDGQCDGSGACKLYDAGVACGITRCESNIQTGFACDGAGHCDANAQNDCELYSCMSGACTVTCSNSNDCSALAYCETDGTCQEKQDDGTECDGPEMCSSGYCVDGLCCNKACAGQCEACDVATAPGTCSPIVGAPHGIRPACGPGTEGDVCGARACDGEQDTNSCVGYVGAETSCRDQTCSEGIETFSATCNGAGECGPAGPVKTKKCEPYVCQGNGCGSAPCESDKDCAPKFRCDPNKHDCVPKDVASCDGDHVIGNPDGTTTDCAPFKCEGSVCKDSCASVDDCVSGFVCDAASHCVAASNGSGSSGAGCGCRVTGGGSGCAPPLLLLILALSMARRRRRFPSGAPAGRLSSAGSTRTTPP